MAGSTASYSEMPFVYDTLLVGEPITMAGVVLTGQGVLLRGTVLGRDAATGKWARATTPARGILAADCDTTAADVNSIIYAQGKFNVAGIVWPAAGTHAEVTQQLWDSGVYLIDIVTREGVNLSPND